MGFRKTAHARIFVDESIPSFLKAHPHAPVKSQLPMLVQPEVSTSFKLRPLAKPEMDDRRNRPLQIHPPFMLKAVLTAVILNTALHLAFQMEFSSVMKMAMPPAAPESEAVAQGESGERVVSYSRPLDALPQQQ